MNAADLPLKWRTDAELLDSYGCTQAAQVARLHATQLDAALRQDATETVTLKEAALMGGYSERRLRELIAEGTLTNAGRKGAPRLKRSDVPRRARKADSTRVYDPQADARLLVERGAA